MAFHELQSEHLVMLSSESVACRGAKDRFYNLLNVLQSDYKVNKVNVIVNCLNHTQCNTVKPLLSTLFCYDNQMV